MSSISIEVDLDEYVGYISDNWLIEELESRNYSVIHSNEDTIDLPLKLTMNEKDNVDLFMSVFRNIDQIELETILKKNKMKTELEIRHDLSLAKKEAKEKGKKIGTKAESNYLTAIKTVQHLSQEKVLLEKEKLINEIKLISEKWDSYLSNFTGFRLKYQDAHEKAVRKEFNKVYEMPKFRLRLKWIDYVLDVDNSVNR